MALEPICRPFPALSTAPSQRGLSAPEILAAMPPQGYAPVIPPGEAAARLEELAGRTAWCHYYRLGEGLATIADDDTRNLGKALSLRRLAVQVRDTVPWITRRGSLDRLSALDLACAEGQHAVELAAHGATTLGIEGRQLYVDRARFAARAFGLQQRATFRQGDVRAVSAAETGIHELVIFSGILHHLGPEDFLPMLRRLAEVTGDTMVLYTHTGCPAAAEKWMLEGPVEIEGGYRGYLYSEHPQGSSDETKLGRMRSSLDNELSFWAEEASLLRALEHAGFGFVAKMLHPSIFGDPVHDYRPVFVCRKAPG